ncbi:MAG: regulatory iron-sulfur-containing complex subunit RicT [Coriobacteriales bacterium]
MPLVIPVRMHFNSEDLWFAPGKTGAGEGDFVIVSTERGTEFGLATSEPFEAPASEVSGKLKPVLRVATQADVTQADGLARKGEQAMPVFRRLVERHGLDIKPAGVEYLFGGEKVIFYFAAEERVDFRGLVHDLAAQFHARVDMRQIGVRDEARLQGGYATCGQELCCRRLGGEFQPVSIRMAKEQDLPLNSAKISGVCGRLMCCLRYEFEAYKDFKQRAPKRNALIDTPLGKAKIVEYNTPRETMTLRLENGKSFTVALSDMTCSEGCRKRAKEQGSPLRPDTVTRETLEQIGTAEIIAQLADLDRLENPGKYAYELDTSLVEPRRRARVGARPAPANASGQGSRGGRKGTQADARGEGTATREPRRRSASGTSRQQSREGAAEQASARADGDTRPARRKGMRPRRQQPGKGAAVQDESQQAVSGQRRQTQAGEVRGRSQRGEATGAAAPQAHDAEQGQHRARRHHSSQDSPVAQAGTPRTRPATSPAEGGEAAPARTRRHRSAGQTGQGEARQRAARPGQAGAESRDGETARQGAGQPAQRRRPDQEGQQRRRPAQQRQATPQAGDGRDATTPPARTPGTQGASGATRRHHRRPGDHGGQPGGQAGRNGADSGGEPRS